MIGVLFRFGDETVEVRAVGDSLYFRTTSTGGQFAPIEALKLSEEGIYKEHPDLEGDPEYKTKAIERLKDNIRGMSEREKAQYIIDELSRYGYVPLYIQQQGKRPEKV